MHLALVPWFVRLCEESTEFSKRIARREFERKERRESVRWRLADAWSLGWSTSVFRVIRVEAWTDPPAPYPIFLRREKHRAGGLGQHGQHEAAQRALRENTELKGRVAALTEALQVMNGQRCGWGCVGVDVAEGVYGVEGAGWDRA